MGANAANVGYIPGRGGFDAQAAAGTGAQGLRLFNPEHLSSPVTPMEGQSFADLKSGFANKRAEMAQQRAVADQVRNAKALEAGKPSSAVSSPDYQAGPVEYQYYGDSMFGVLPKDYKAPTDTGAKTWTDRTWDFSGVDKGWEQYEADWQKAGDYSQFPVGSPEWYAAANRSTLQGAGVDMLHSIEGDKRDPYGFGSDYARFYDKTHGAGALQAEANRYARGFAENDPAFAGYEKGYGDIDWTDAAQVEDWFRRAQMGGARTAAEQSRISQNARTELTEGLIMSAVGAGIGGMAGIGGLGSAWSNAQTAGGALNQFG